MDSKSTPTNIPVTPAVPANADAPKSKTVSVGVDSSVPLTLGEGRYEFNVGKNAGTVKISTTEKMESVLLIIHPNGPQKLQHIGSPIPLYALADKATELTVTKLD